MRRGGHAHSSRGALRCRAPRPLVGCTEQHLLDGPDGTGLAVGARVTPRNPGARERRSAAAVEPPAGGAFHDARGVPLRAGNRPAGLPPSSYQRPARPPARHPVRTDLRVPSRRPAHTPNRPHPGPAPPAVARSPPPRPRIPGLAEACSAALAAVFRAFRITSDNYIHHGHLGNLPIVDVLEKVPSPLRALTRLDRLSCRPWRSNSTHG